MLDLFHRWDGDLAIGSTGDIALCEASVMTTQRIYRRLLTNPGDYIWNLTYGSGLASFVGAPANGPAIESVVRNQLQLETSVASTPAPVITTAVTDPANGIVVVDMSFTNADLDSVSQLSLRLGQ